MQWFNKLALRFGSKKKMSTTGRPGDLTRYFTPAGCVMLVIARSRQFDNPGADRVLTLYVYNGELGFSDMPRSCMTMMVDVRELEQ